MRRTVKPDFDSAQQLTPLVDRKWRDRTAMHPDSAREVQPAILAFVRILNERVCRLRRGPLEARRRCCLVRLYDVLAATSLTGRNWMIMGPLLGCMRDGGPIRWDRDSDFGFMHEDLPHFLDAARKLNEHDYVMRPPQVNNDGRTTKWA